MRDILAYLLALADHWIQLLTGGAITGLLGLYERWKQKPVSIWFYFKGVLTVFFLLASFLAWQEQFKRANSLEQEVARQKQELSTKSNIPAITVNVPPPPPPIIVQNQASGDQPPTGFIQLNEFRFSTAYTELTVGKPISINFVYMNPGPQPVTNEHSFEAVFYATKSIKPEDNEFDQNEREIRMMFERTRKKVIKENLGKIVPQTSVGIPFVKPIVSEPLSGNAVRGVLDGSVRIYALAWATWKDSRKRVGIMQTTCYWLQPPETLNLTSSLQWHSCAAPKE
jgi:hypothetical protein